MSTQYTCHRCNAVKAGSEMVARGGKPSSLCRECFAASLRGKGKRQRAAAPAAAAPAPAAAPTSIRVASGFGFTAALEEGRLILTQPADDGEATLVLRKMRVGEKMSANEIVAWRAKRGMSAMTAAQINRAIELLDLPDFAQALIDDGTLSAEDARPLLVAKQDTAALKHAVKQIKVQAERMGGRADDDDVADALSEGYEKSGAQRIGQTYGKTVTYFDHTTRCKGCEFYRPIGYFPYCMNPTLFAEHNKAAKDEGFGPGGEAPRKASAPSAKHEQKQKEQRQQQRVESLERRQAEWFYVWLRQTLIADVKDRGIVQAQILAYAAANGARIDYQWDPYELLVRHITQAELWRIARVTLEKLDEDLLSYLAHDLKLDVSGLLRIDVTFVKMLPRPQLERLCEAANIEIKGRKVSELQAALLEPEVVARLGCPAIALQVYDTPLDRDHERDDDEFDDDNEDEG